MRLFGQSADINSHSNPSVKCSKTDINTHLKKDAFMVPNSWNRGRGVPILGLHRHSNIMLAPPSTLQNRVVHFTTCNYA